MDDLITLTRLQAMVQRRGQEVSECWIRQLADKGVIPSRRDTAGRRLFSEKSAEALVEYLEASRRRRAG